MPTNFDWLCIYAISSYEKLKSKSRLFYFWIVFELIIAILAMLFLPDKWRH